MRDSCTRAISRAEAWHAFEELRKQAANERLIPIIKDAPNGSELKIFYFIAHNQPSDGIHGYVIDKTQLQLDLKLGRTNFLVALRWLKENLVVNELKQVYESAKSVKK